MFVHDTIGKVGTTAKKGESSFFAPVVQTKLAIGAVNDVCEVEADAVADKVVAGNTQVAIPSTPSAAVIQKKCATCQEEEKIYRKENTNMSDGIIRRKCSNCENEEKIYQKENRNHAKPLAQQKDKQATRADTDISNQIIQQFGKGEAMDKSTKQSMEKSFGLDFSAVRIHNDANAQHLSQSLNAQAFTVGNHIFFNEGKYQPGSTEGKHLLAHELTHTVQQSGGAAAIQQKPSGALIQRGILKTVGGAIADGAEFAWDNTGGAAIRVGGKVIEWAADKAEEIINEIAPGLIDFLRSDIWETIKEMIAKGLDKLTGGLFTKLQEEGLGGVIDQFVSAIVLSLQGAVADACNAFKSLADRIYEFLKSIGNSALKRISAAFTKVSGILETIWSKYASPVIDAIKYYASETWQWIEDKAKWLWGLVSPIIDKVEQAWNWLMEQFDIAWEKAGSVLDWLTEKATEAWNAIVGFIEPIKKPLMVIGAILVLLSPLGPIALIGATAYGIYTAIQWVRSNWNNEVFVKFRATISKMVLEPIQSGLTFLQGLVNGALGWLGSMMGALRTAFNSLVTAISNSTIFKIVKGIVSTIANAVALAANFVIAKCMVVIAFVGSIVSKVYNFVRPFLVLCAKLLILATNPWMIPIVLYAWYWRALPDCFKPPIINFVLKMMIAVLGKMPNFAMFGDTWKQVKQKIIDFLQQTLKKSDKEKVTVANRVAKMVSEMDLTLISNQIEAARGAPAQFEGQLEEELIGADLTKPLPFEKTEQDALQSQMQISGVDEHISELDQALFKKSSYTEQDITVDGIESFEPSEELQQSIQHRLNGGDGTLEFGANDDPSRTVHGILAEMLPGGGEQEEGAEPGAPDYSTMSEEEANEMRLQAMMSASNEEMGALACATASAETKGNDAGSVFPPEAKFGPLTRSQRARFSWNQMMSGLGHWWKCNKSWLIPTIIGVIVVLVVAEVLSGGAVTAALPAIAGALAPIMIGVAAVRAAYYLGEYVYKSVAGEIAMASKALARAFAVAAVEAIFALLGSSAFWKGLKGGASAAMKAVGKMLGAAGKVVSKTGRVGTKLVEGLSAGGRYVLKTTGAAVNKGKLVMQGVKGKLGKGIKTVEELAEKLFGKVRFRKFRMHFTKGWFKLEGYINPWILLATGKVEYFERKELKVVGQPAKETPRLGDSVKIVGTERKGVVIGVKGTPPKGALSDTSKASEYVQELAGAGSTYKKRKAAFDELENIKGKDLASTRRDRIAILQERETTAALRKGLPIQPTDFQAHHVVPRELRKEFADLFTTTGFDIENGLKNGIMVPPDSQTLADAIALNPAFKTEFGTSAFHLGSHPAYTDVVRKRLIVIRDLLNRPTAPISPSEALSMIDDIVAEARAAIKAGAGKTLNQITF